MNKIKNFFFIIGVVMFVGCSSVPTPQDKDISSSHNRSAQWQHQEAKEAQKDLDNEFK